MPKVVISGYYGFNNIGDEAILKGIIDGIKGFSQDTEIVVLSQYPEFTSKKHNVRSIKRMNFFSIIKEIKDCDLLVSGGGSLLQDVTSKRSILYYIAIIHIAKILNKKVMIYSQGIGPVNKNYNRNLLKRVLNKVDFINVRDENSKQELLNMGIEKNILVTMDTVFGIKKPNIEIGKEILRDINIDFDKKIVGLSIRPWNNNKQIVSEISKVCEILVEEYDYQVLFIPFHFYADSSIIKDIYKNIDKKFRKNVLVLDKYLYVDEYISLVGNLDFLIGMRLHALIFSVLMGVPVVGLSYDPKINNFLNFIEKNNVISILNINFNDIMNDVKYLIDNIDEERELISRKRDEFREITDIHNKILMDLIENRGEYFGKN
ncbi:MAG: polysaccharide pyruvyl transferase CsaB [Tepidibacter sp.]|jgi:polysaccharide pyruvyl transferase CsaB|uniref:polysaccharide pyruvyl transferase CsaB n=1 Tax=Tepidibacter sp. TaxID=2529387 RepID=UPI0025D959F7|nr:polysaccharide pyruvyl transferase CsaB [Tepidibacter sp.]MCT4507635.1 polysaccharide pyruvyl transferase CsaB [Tepidibacter sp.]